MNVFYMIPKGIKITNSNTFIAAKLPMNIFWNRGFLSGTRKAARKNGMYVVMNTGRAPHHGYTHIKAGVEAKKISTDRICDLIKPVHHIQC